MAGWIKTNGVWKEIQAVFRKTSSVWQSVYRIYSKETAGWKLIWKPKYLPPNLIIMGQSTLSSMDNWLNGGGSAYNDKFLMSGTGGATGGATTHYAGSHGAANQPVTNHVGNSYNQNWSLFGGSYHAGGKQSEHAHTIAHTHTDHATNIPVNVKLTPYIINNNKLINAGGLFLTELSTAPAGFTMVTSYSGRYLKFSSTPGNGSESGSHGHYITMNVSTENMPYDGHNNTKNHWNSGHYHHFNHTHTATNTPLYSTLRLMSCDNDITDQTEIPIGAIVPIINSDIPGGWERYTTGDGRLLKLLNGATTNGGSSTHDHLDTTLYTDYMTISRSERGHYTSPLPTEYTYDNNHRHSVTHGHIGNVNWMPPYKEIIFIKKIS